VPQDGTEHFPRTDPAVIMLVTDPDDRALLARNAAWPGRRVSILAGFVDRASPPSRR
jgi:NTP pyrophosphohydrolases containing a Zn-finger, probably nucleic-acid-binding